MRGRLLLGTVLTGRAWGHAVVVESHPRNGAVVAHAPKEITLRFNATIEPRLARLSLYDLRGVGIPLPVQPKVSGPTDRLTVILIPLQRGSYVTCGSGRSR